MSTDPYRAIESQADTTVPELAHYERVQRWRQGGLGQVWLARDTSIGREVALKTVNDQSLDACAATGRLLEEARITGQLEHPGVVPVYAVGRDAAGGPFYAMRLVRGKTLTESISDFHELTDDTSRRNERRALLRSLISVANVVAYAHSRGVVHLDLKPDNVVVGMFGEVTLLDWGLAIQFSGGRVFGSHEGLADPNQLDARNPVGTPGYMAPEQARADYNSIGIQTDVYGLGAILFEMLCGQAPHLDKPPDCMVDLVGRECTPDVRSRADVPASLAEICSKAMAFYPTDRFEGALAFVEHLQNWLDEEPLLNYRSAVRKFEERITRDPRDLPSREGQARYRVYLALVLSGMDRNPEAAESLAIAISTYRILVANRPTQARYRAELASALLHQRGVLRRAGKLNESEAATRDALREYQHLIERGEESAQEQSIVAMSLLSIDDEATIGGDSRTTATIQEIMEQFRETRLGSEPASPEDTILELTDIPFYRYAADTAEHGASAIREESDHLMFDDESTRFQLLTIFQVGGLSQLFIAKDKQLQREVLVKTLKVEHRYSRELAQRLYQEAEIMARLEHPGIVPVYSVGDFPDGQPYFAMKKVSGQNLADAITSFHSVAGEVKRVDDWHRHVRSMLLHFVAVCDTAAYAHGRGVVHGDIKPGNVILGQFGETILMDWGLATVLERDKLLPLSFGPAWAVPAKGRYGTPRYMSPEQAFGDGVDYRTDVFGLGATLYFILTGRPPYGVSLSIADTLQEAMAVRIARPRDVNRFLSTSLEQVCLKALAREKDKRYQSAVQLSTDINSCLADDTLVQ